MDELTKIERIVQQALAALQALGYGGPALKTTNWQLCWADNHRAEDGLVAARAAGQTPVLVLAPHFRLARDLVALLHETIHLAQLLTGELRPGAGHGLMIWHGQVYPPLSAEQPAALQAQPWEAEVGRLLPRLIAKMLEL